MSGHFPWRIIWEGRSLARLLTIVLGVVVLSFAGALAIRWTRFDDALTATVTRGTLRILSTESGALQPSQAITYRSPIPGRETEILWLAPEGSRVQKGDLLAKLDASELERELERSIQSFQQAQADATIAALERDEARANVDALEEGDGTGEGDEELFRLELAQKRAGRLRAELESLQPLFEKGVITREELDQIAFELEQAEAEAGLARRKNNLLVATTRPRERQRVRRSLAQREAQLEVSKAKLEAARGQVSWLTEMIQGCAIYARKPGLVIHEEYLAANPRRKVRLGDRVTSSQGLVTLPEVSDMVVETSVREADIHRVQPGQPAEVRLDAFPDARLSGSVRRVGNMARSSTTPLFEDKRFDVTVEVHPTELDLRPEMTARVDILLEEIPNVLLAPVNAVFEREGHYVAHVVTPWRIRTTRVELGATNGVYVEVRVGLEEGDRLRLLDVVGARTEAGVPGTTPAPVKGKDFAPN